MFGSLGQRPVRAVVVLTSATLPAAAAMAIEPVASGCGSVMPLLAPAACWTRKYWPGARVVGGSSVTDHVDEVAPAYCTDQPVRSAGVVPRLNSSMKSLRYGAFELPPPPNSWEITICAVGVAIGVGLGDGEAVGEKDTCVREADEWKVWEETISGHVAWICGEADC